MILIDFLETLAFAGVMALIAYVYRDILLREPILHWFLKFGERWEDKWFYAPVWGCHKCIAGQLTFWFYLIWRLPIEFSPETRAYNAILTRNVHLYHLTGYCLIGHIFAICAAILFTEQLTNKLNK
jgi:hypothetical protein